MRSCRSRGLAQHRGMSNSSPVPPGKLRLAVFTAAAVFLAMNAPARSADEPLRLTLRSRTETNAVEKKAEWDPKKTALVICDMWDDHWCKSAARRVGEMAGPLN